MFQSDEGGDVDLPLSLLGPVSAGLFAPGKAREPAPLPAHPTLELLWEQATDFAVVARFTRRREKDTLPLDAFPGAEEVLTKLAPGLTGVVRAKEWPGTRRRSGAHLLFGPVGADARRVLCDGASSLFWELPGFEDLMLFRREKLLFYVCTHERFGAVSGPSALLETIGADVRLGGVGAAGEALRIRGTRLTGPEAARFLGLVR